MRALLFVLTLNCLLLPDAHAHASEQGFVLLLPTKLYIASGVLAVLLTLLLLAILPAKNTANMFSWRAVAAVYSTGDRTRMITSLFSLCVFVLLLYIGITGTRDPLENLLPLFIWTFWWIGVAVLHGFTGNMWFWFNPWSGLYLLLQKKTDSNRQLKILPNSVSQWPAVILILMFVAFALADIAPDDPSRLAIFAAAYWAFTMVCVLLFGEAWFKHGECFSIMFHRFAQLAPFGLQHNALRIGMPGWRFFDKPELSVSAAIFILVLLGTGSFDGLNETFLWLHLIGVNPLEFPGRSAVVVPTVVGLVFANVLLIIVYGICIYMGVKLAYRHDGHAVSFMQAFNQLSISILPIAFAYHFAHYLIAFLVNIQYTVAAVSDPFANGADILGLGEFYVTTGFMNSHHTVEAIWLIQAAAVVTGHILSVLLAHAMAINLFGDARRAMISQVPLAAFMVVYTFIGLWLLAAPRGA